MPESLTRRLDCERGVQSAGRRVIDLILDYYNCFPAMADTTLS